MPKTITDRRLLALRDQARTRGDAEMVLTCELALAGKDKTLRQNAREECAALIADPPPEWKEESR